GGHCLASELRSRSELPRRPRQPPVNSRPPMEQVFLVDDDAGVRRSLARVLNEEGFNVEEFDSAEAFLARVEPPVEGCIVLDVSMPGLDGLELQTRLRDAGRDLPIVFVTGYGDI